MAQRVHLVLLVKKVLLVKEPYKGVHQGICDLLQKLRTCRRPLLLHAKMGGYVLVVEDQMLQIRLQEANLLIYGAMWISQDCNYHQ